MRNQHIDYKIIKILKTSNGNNEISIIQIKDKKYILKKADSSDMAVVNMLKNETNILYKLRNFDIAPKLYHYCFNEQNNSIIIELIKGKPINKLNLETTKIKIALMLKITDSVKKLHKHNIVHCDLKPSNILLDLNKNIKIIDYGISVDNHKNYFAGYGSVKYCSKNQLLNKEIDENVDLYSLGIIFYELIFGKSPFTGTKEEIIKKKKLNLYDKTNNQYLNLIFSKLFDDAIYKYKTIEEFEKDLKLLLAYS